MDAALAVSQRQAQGTRGVGEEPLEVSRWPDGGSGGGGGGVPTGVWRQRVQFERYFCLYILYLFAYLFILLAFLDI